jgi:hypothetical protein
MMASFCVSFQWNTKFIYLTEDRPRRLAGGMKLGEMVVETAWQGIKGNLEQRRYTKGRQDRMVKRRLKYIDIKPGTGQRSLNKQIYDQPLLSNDLVNNGCC